jgi:hypothetical protein
MPVLDLEPSISKEYINTINKPHTAKGEHQDSSYEVDDMFPRSVSIPTKR